MLTESQNAMNAAEITDKLGLHSLRQRAWVCTCHMMVSSSILLTVSSSIFNQPVLLLVTVSTRD